MERSQAVKRIRAFGRSASRRCGNRILLHAALCAFTILIPAGAMAQMNVPLTLSCHDARVVAAQIRSQSDGPPASLTTTPVTGKGEHVPGLGPSDFTVAKGRKTARILGVRELTSVENTVMRVVFMVDNSQSMSPYLGLLRSTLETMMQRFSPAVRVSVIMFNEQRLADPPYEYNGHPLPLVRLPYTTDKKRAVTYTKKMLAERLLSLKTYLYDGVHGACDQLRADTGTVDRSFVIVFSDGADNASTVDPETVLREDKHNTIFYTIDYLTARNDFLVRLASASGGEHFQAAKAEDLASIFDAITNKIVAKGYEITYRFKDPPRADLAVSTDTLRMEQDVVRETFPLLNYIFFDQGSAALPGRYRLLSGEAAGTFSENSVEGGTMEFYYNMLNVLGSRLRQRPAATITITGYLNDAGVERGNTTLATDRARTIASYLTTVWGIDAGRITVSAGRLPPTPSSSRDDDGRAENSRAEVTSDDWDLLAPVTFIRRTAKLDPPQVRILTRSDVPERLAQWTLDVSQNGTSFDVRSGSSPEQSMTWNWKNTRGEQPANSGSLLFRFAVTDSAGDAASAAPVSIPVKDIHRESRLNVTFDGGVTKEKIGLILFPFDVATPGERNERIMRDHVYPRLTSDCRVAITGYTDVIGTEEYNLTLSQNRANAVRTLLLNQEAGVLPESAVTATGLGETSPLYPNDSPEGRFYNRTVQVLIERTGR